MIKRNLLKFGVVVMVSACMVGCGNKNEESKPVETTTGVVAEVETTTTPEVETTTSVEVETTTEEPTTEEVTTEAPTEKPTEAPTQKPTEAPTQKPTEAPTQKPTMSIEEIMELQRLEDIDSIIKPYVKSNGADGLAEGLMHLTDTYMLNDIKFQFHGQYTDEQFNDMVYGQGIDWIACACQGAVKRWGTNDGYPKADGTTRGYTKADIKQFLLDWNWSEADAEYIASYWEKNASEKPTFDLFKRNKDYVERANASGFATKAEVRGTLTGCGRTQDEIAYALSFCTLPETR